MLNCLFKKVFITNMLELGGTMSNWLNILTNINWDAVSAIAACLEVIIILVPAVIFFFYTRLKFAKLWISNKSQNGIQIAIHNKSKNSIYLLNEKIITSNKSGINKFDIHINFEDDSKFICIQPDEAIFVDIDFAKYSIVSGSTITLELKFGGKFRKVRKKIKGV